MRQLTKAHLVQYLAGLRIGVIVALGRLVLRQAFQSSTRKPGGNARVLEGDDQAITPKKGDNQGTPAAGTHSCSETSRS